MFSLNITSPNCETNTVKDVLMVNPKSDLLGVTMVVIHVAKQ